MCFESVHGHSLGGGTHLVAVYVKGTLHLRIEIPLKYLEPVYLVDAIQEGEVNGKGIQQIDPRSVWSDLARTFELRADGIDCQPTSPQFRLRQHALGSFISYEVEHQCPTNIKQLEVTFGFLSDVYRKSAMLHFSQDKATQRYIFGHNQTTHTIKLRELTLAETIKEFIWQGVVHIFIGIDHILFLVCLILPAVMYSRDNRREPVDQVRPALWKLFAVVTGFTIAHSITLSMVVLDVFIPPPSWLVESVIALSIMVVAVNNIFYWIKHEWALAFGFGLMHGMGFASVFSELQLPENALIAALVSFNVGVELGQLGIVLAVFPLLIVARKNSWYENIVIKGGSGLAFFVAGFWMLERVGWA